MAWGGREKGVERKKNWFHNYFIWTIFDCSDHEQRIELEVQVNTELKRKRQSVNWFLCKSKTLYSCTSIVGAFIVKM